LTYAFDVDGSTGINTITNNSCSELTCGTSLAPAPGGVLPPVWDVIGNGQTLCSIDDAGQAGRNQYPARYRYPAGAYVAPASCVTEGVDPTTVWVSDHPGLPDVLATLPWTS